MLNEEKRRCHSHVQDMKSAFLHRLSILFVCFDALRPSQQFLSHVGTISCLPELIQYQADNCLAQVHKTVTPLRLWRVFN